MFNLDQPGHRLNLSLVNASRLDGLVDARGTRTARKGDWKLRRTAAWHNQESVFFDGCGRGKDAHHRSSPFLPWVV